jgi:hypothetical protein
MEKNKTSVRDSIIIAVSIILICRLMWKFLNRVTPNSRASSESDVKSESTLLTDRKPLNSRKSLPNGEGIIYFIEENF